MSCGEIIFLWITHMVVFCVSVACIGFEVEYNFSDVPLNVPLFRDGKISPDFDLHACGPISHIKAGPCTRKFILFNRGECPTAENFFYVDKTYGFILRVIVLIGVLVVFNFSDVPLDVPFLLGGTFDSPTFTLHSER